MNPLTLLYLPKNDKTFPKSKSFFDSGEILCSLMSLRFSRVSIEKFLSVTLMNLKVILIKIINSPTLFKRKKVKNNHFFIVC